MSMDERYPLALPEGTILAGQYMIEKVLGQGGFGITYRATDHKTNLKVAVKEFFPDTLAYREMTTVVSYPGERSENYAYGKESFLQEAKTLAEFIGNVNIVRIHSYFEENGTAYFVMDYIEGKSFDEYIKERGGKISVEEAKNILVPVMDALGVVHSKGIVHRDVTPDNIYITSDGTVKLLDFGAARYSLGDKSRSLDVILKHGFAPKEQYTRRGKQGPFTDIYSLGATFYFAITGKRPPDSVERLDEDDLIPPSNLGVNITDYQERAILQALSVQPAERFQSMAEFKKILLNESTVTNQIFFPTPEPVTTPVVQQIPPAVQQAVQSAPTQTGQVDQPLRAVQKPEIIKSKKLIIGLSAAGGVCVLIIAFLIGSALSNKNDVTTSGSGSVNQENTSQSSGSYVADNSTTSTPESVTPEPSTPEPATPEPSTPEPAKPEPVNYNVSELTIVGNTAANIKNNGLYTLNENNEFWVSDDLHSLVTTDSYIYQNQEGRFSCLSYYDGILYFIYDGKAYMKNMLDGSSEIQISELTSYGGNIENLYVTTGCYFVYADKKLYRISRKKGEEEEWISVSDPLDIAFDNDGWLYYVGVNSDGYSTLFKVAADDFSDCYDILHAYNGDVYITDPVISGNYLYFIFHNGFNTQIARYNMNSYEKSDYAWDISGYVHEIGAKGGSNANHAYALNVIDDYIFFTAFDASNSSYALYAKTEFENEFTRQRDNAVFPCVAKRGTNYEVNYLAYNEETGKWTLKYKQY